MEEGNLFNSMAPVLTDETKEDMNNFLSDSKTSSDESEEFRPGHYYVGLVIFDHQNVEWPGTHITITFRENCTKKDVEKMKSEAEQLKVSCFPMKFKITGTEMLGDNNDIYTYLVEPNNKKNLGRLKTFYKQFYRRTIPYEMKLHSSANNEAKQRAMNKMHKGNFTVAQIYVRGIFTDEKGKTSVGKKMFI